MVGDRERRPNAERRKVNIYCALSLSQASDWDLHLILFILYSLYITRTYSFYIIIYLSVIYIYTPRQIQLSAESKMLLFAVNGSEYRNARLLKMLRIRDD